MIDRDKARHYWRESGLQVKDISAADLRALRKQIDIKMAAHGGKIAMRTTTAKRTNWGAEVRCSGRYFDDREAVTFYKPDANKLPVGFAGWADDINVQPILDGFMSWLAERIRRRLPSSA